MKIMEEKHGFKATLNQYKKQLGKWGLDNKRIKDFEYQAMLKKKRKREREDPPKESAFRLNGAEVDSSKISRYKKRKGVNEEDVTSDIGTPSNLSCYTPPVIGCSPVPLSPMPSSIGDGNANGHTGLGSDMTSFNGSNSVWGPSYSTPSAIISIPKPHSSGIVATNNRTGLESDMTSCSGSNSGWNPSHSTPSASISIPTPPSSGNVDTNNRTRLGSDMTSFNGSNSGWNPAHFPPSVIFPLGIVDVNVRIKRVLDTVFVPKTSLSSLIQDLRSYGDPYANVARDIEEFCNRSLSHVLGLFSSSFDTGSGLTTFKILYCTEIELKTLTSTGLDWVILTNLAKARLLHYIFTNGFDMERGGVPQANNNIILSSMARGFEEPCTGDIIYGNQEVSSSWGGFRLVKIVLDGDLISRANQVLEARSPFVAFLK